MIGYSNYFSNYTISKEAYKQVAQECKLYGKTALLIGGEKALKAGKSKLEKALEGTEISILGEILHKGEATYKSMEEYLIIAQEKKVDMIFGMGGGKALDSAKGTAEKGNLPVFTFPTIAATCAATSALSVVYTQEGHFDSFYSFKKPPRHCFMDLEIIANAPSEFLRAGMGDTIGKHFECHFSSRGDELAHSSYLGREISNLCYAPLANHGVAGLEDCKNHMVSEALGECVLANIVSTGLVSLMVKDEYNSALAHATYYGLVSIKGFEEENLHGDVVAYGVLVQLAVDGQMDKCKELKMFLDKLGIRTKLKDMGVILSKEGLDSTMDAILAGPDLVHIPYEINKDMLFQGLEIVENM